VFAEAEKVDADLIGKNTFLDDIAQHLRLMLGFAGLVESDVAKGINAKFYKIAHLKILTAANYAAWRYVLSMIRYMFLAPNQTAGAERIVVVTWTARFQRTF